MQLAVKAIVYIAFFLQVAVVGVYRIVVGCLLSYRQFLLMVQEQFF